MRVLYLVHDLDDDAVRRRRRFLEMGGARVKPLGFRRRRDQASEGSDPGDPLVLGITENGRMVRRARSAIAAAFGSAAWRGSLETSDVVVARTLEMLLVAVVARARARRSIPIVYECLDVHRLMTDRGLAGRLLRLLEGRLLAASALLIVSSPRFIESYFTPAHGAPRRWLLLENRLLADEVAPVASPEPPTPPPWRIGWFGVLRCRRSLALLAALATRSAGAVEVVLRGRPALDAIPDFHEIVASTPGMRFDGPYDRTTDLACLYGGVHVAWAIDFYEAGRNSDWLLPNRLYEASLHGAVPLALASVETGRWLARHGCGLLLDDPIDGTLPALFSELTVAAWTRARGAIARLDRDELVESREAAAAFVAVLGGLAAAAAPSDHDPRVPVAA